MLSFVFIHIAGSIFIFNIFIVSADSRTANLSEWKTIAGTVLAQGSMLLLS